MAPLIPKYYDQIKKISFVNLYELARLVGKIDQSRFLELLDTAAAATERGFKDTMREIEGKTPSDNCDHINLKNFFKCRKCGKFIEALGYVFIREDDFKKMNKELNRLRMICGEAPEVCDAASV